MLDKKSEKVLKLAIALYNGDIEKDIPIYSAKIKLSFTELNSLCRNLHSSGYLDSYWYASSPSDPVLIKLSHNGLHYFERKKKTSFYFWIPILLSNLIAAIALLISILTYIKQ